MAASRRETIEAIYRAAIDQVEAGVAVSRVLSRETDHALTVGDQTLDIGDSGVWAIAIGKAGCQMMASVETIAGDRFAGGLVVTKSVPVDIQLRSEILVGSHPVPDARSLEAGDRLIDFVRTVPDGALVICLISGGGSALADALRPGVTLEQLRDITATLLRSGASIGEMNAVRARLSRIKGGGLLALLNGRRVVNLIISDVLGNPLQVIASGPTVMPDGHEVAGEVIRRYSLDITLPTEARTDLAPPLMTLIIADINAALAASADAARQMGLAAHVLTSSVDIEARQAGRLFGGIVADVARGRGTLTTPCCILAGGETVVTLRGGGIGGRNCEAAVAAAIAIAGIEDCVVGCLATDGDDGTSGAAGGIVDGTTLHDRRTAEAALAGNDTYPWLRGRGAAFETGPSGTNVNDLFIGIVAPADWTPD